MEIGAHTVNHPPLPAHAPSVQAEQITREQGPAAANPGLPGGDLRLSARGIFRRRPYASSKKPVSSARLPSSRSLPVSDTEAMKLPRFGVKDVGGDAFLGAAEPVVRPAARSCVDEMTGAGTGAAAAAGPLVSAVIIFLDAEKFIAESIESVLAQTYPNIELLLVDDGSTDGGTAIARALRRADAGPRPSAAAPGTPESGNERQPESRRQAAPGVN